MKKKIALSGITIGLLVLALWATYTTGKVLDQRYDKVIAEIKRSPSVLLEVERYKTSLISRQHSYRLTFLDDSELTIAFEEMIQLYPWGAKAKIHLIQQGGVFEQLREETNFEKLPLDLQWRFNSVLQSGALQARMEAFDIVGKRSEAEDRLEVKPLSLNATLSATGQVKNFDFSWQGLQLNSDGILIDVGPMHSDGHGEFVDKIFLLNDSSYTLSSLRMSQEQTQQHFEISDLTLSANSKKQGEHVELSNRLDIAAISFSDIAQRFDVKDIKLSLLIDALSWELLAKLQQVIDDESADETALVNALKRVFEDGFALHLDSGIGSLALTNAEGNAQGEARAKGKLELAAFDFEAIELNPMVLMQGIAGDMDIAVSQSLVDLAMGEDVAYDIFAQLGYLTLDEGLIKTKLELVESEVKVNGLPLAF